MIDYTYFYTLLSISINLHSCNHLLPDRCVQIVLIRYVKKAISKQAPAFLAIQDSTY